MKRFMTSLVAVVLVFGLSFPAPALAGGKPTLESANSAGRLSAQSGGHEWYVAPNGADGPSVPGTIDQPFATISYATTRMSGGDTVYVRGGTYRDEVTHVPSGSAGQPSTICAYEGEEVWMTGAEPVTGWTRTAANGNIWVADVGWDMRDITEYAEIGTGYDGGHYAKTSHYENLVFSEGNPLPEGRWPNATVAQFLDRDCYATADRANADAIVDAELPDGIDFTGAEVWIASGGGYESQTGTITSYEPADHRLRIKPNASSWMYGPRGGNYYYVTKSLKTLDSAGEWYKDQEAGKLYLYEPGGVDPNGLGIEFQKRAHVIRVGYGRDSKSNVVEEDASYVTFRGINARLGAVAFSSKASHCTFEQATVDCPDHALSSQAYGVAAGIMLAGTDNLVTRCEVKRAYGSAITLWGSRNRVVNNHVHDTGYEHHEEQAAIRIGGSQQLVSHNSVHHVMRSAVSGFFEASVISYNDLYDCMRVSQDGGVMYFNAHDYENSEIHHNWLHDTRDFPADQMHVGLYMDSFTVSMVAYRNVVWGIQSYEEGNRKVNNNGKHLTYQINPNSLNNVIVNNTFLNYRPTHLNFYPNHDISGTVFVNNIYQSMSYIDGDTYYPWNWIDIWDTAIAKGYAVKRDILKEMGAYFDADHNLEGLFRNNTWPPIENQWTDPAHHVYTLAAGSKAIDAGRVIPGVTDGYTGQAPDLGAYEYGGAYWEPGCDLARDIEDGYSQNTAIPYRNLLANGSFEASSVSGAGQDGSISFDSWTGTGTPQRSPSLNSWGTWGWLIKQGSRCAVLDADGESLTQHVSGLKPNTAYRIGGYGFVAGDYVYSAGLTRIVKSDSSEVAGSNLPKGGTVSLGGYRQLEFGGVDFGSGRDRVVVGLRSPKANQGDDRQVVSVALGSAGNVVGSYEVTKGLTVAESNWRWVTIDLDRAYAGSQDVFLVLGGNFTGTSFGGLYPDTSASADTLTMTASSGTPLKSADEVVVSSWYKPFEGDYYAPHSGVVVTGASGELDLSVTKHGGDLVAYVDAMFLCELPGEENFGSAETCSHVFDAKTANPSWEWRTVEDYRKAYLTVTCDKCGKRFELEAPLTREETATVESCTATFPVVGDTYSTSDVAQIPYRAVSVSAAEHGSVSVPAATEKRGAKIEVTTAPDNGYALTKLTYKTAKGSANNILRTRSFTMPPNDVTVAATFGPALFMFPVDEQRYAGSPVKPAPKVIYGDKELVEGADYTLSYENNAAPGTATVTATGKGDYEGSVSVDFTIIPASVEGGSGSASSGGGSQTGSAEETPETGPAGGNPGAAPSEGDLGAEPTEGNPVPITPAPVGASIADAVVSGLAPQPYTGSPLEPVPSVVLDGAVLRPGVDYDVSYRDNVNAGFATVTVSGKGGYTGAKGATFEITPVSIAAAKVSRFNWQPYAGRAVEPALKVVLGSTTLRPGVDYTVSYQNNRGVGTAIAKVTGTGNYTGVKSVAFEIVKDANPMAVRKAAKVLKAQALKRAKGAVRPFSVSRAQGNVTFKKEGGSKRLSVARKTGKVTVKKGTPKGAYRIRVAVKAAGNAYYLAKTISATAVVNVK